MEEFKPTFRYTGDGKGPIPEPAKEESPMEKLKHAQNQEDFNKIKVGDAITYKDASGELKEGFVVKSKHETDQTVTVSKEEENGAYSYGTTVSMDEVVDFYTKKSE